MDWLIQTMPCERKNVIFNLWKEETQGIMMKLSDLRQWKLDLIVLVVFISYWIRKTTTGAGEPHQ